MGIPLDLTDHQSGRLTVLQFDGIKNNKAYWKCYCNPEHGGCGKYKVVQGTRLKHGVTVSCGCIRGEKQKIDLIGSTYNKLKVLEYAGRCNSNKTQWKCICECGNEKIVRGNDLRTGKVTSCGCNKIADIVDQRFGRLVVKAFAYVGKNGSYYYHVECDCGNKNITNGADLRRTTRRITKSCGCLAKENCSSRFSNPECGSKVGLDKTLTLNGVTRPWDEWSEITGICKSTLRGRIDALWSDEDILTRPLMGGDYANIRREVSKLTKKVRRKVKPKELMPTKIS